MSSVERVLLDHIGNSIRNAGVVAAQRVGEMRPDTLWDEQLPAIDITPMEESVRPMSDDVDEHRFTFRVDVCVRASALDGPVSAVADPLVVAVHKAIADGASALAGICRSLRLSGRRWLPQTTDGSLLRVEMRYTAIWAASAAELAYQEI